VRNDTSRTTACAHVIGTARPLAGAQAITIAGGVFASVGPTSAPSTDRLLAMPALVNAHDHGRAVRTSSIGADAKPLESWLHYLALFPSVDPYLAAAMTFTNSALGGAGTVMVHYTRAGTDRSSDGGRRSCARGAMSVFVQVLRYQ
jgi:cytosine/adenosine deaminase-related metal-dependent hydrolase